MEFEAEPTNKTTETPFFEEVSSDGGRGGHSTRKSELELQGQIAAAIGRLGGMVTGWQGGTAVINGQRRYGYRMHFTISNEEGELIPGRMDIAALPIKTKEGQRPFQNKKRQALNMALFNLRNQLETAWRMQILVPDYMALLPNLLTDGGKTIGELWIESRNLSNLLPDKSELTEEEIKEMKSLKNALSKRLHPDTAPKGLTAPQKKARKDQFQVVMAAYKSKDLNKLREISDQFGD